MANGAFRDVVPFVEVKSWILPASHPGSMVERDADSLR